MPAQKITFNEWLPDQPNIIDGLSDAKNVIPDQVGYGPMPNAANLSSSASENINSVSAGKYATTTELFAGGGTKLFKFNSSTTALTDVSKAGGYSGNNRWKFVQFGSKFLATNGNNAIQSWTIGTSTKFADLSADAPIAKFMTVVRDFVVCANIGTTEPNKVQWSDISDATTWTTGGASQADYQYIPDGDITGITGGEFGIVLTDKSVSRMTYIGSPLYMQFDNISPNIGCTVSGSVAQYGRNTFFLSEDGFYMTNGQEVLPIGAEKVDRYFYKNADVIDFPNMSATADPINKLVIWNYKKTDATRELLIYNWVTQRWSRCETTADYLSSSATPNVDLEGLDSYGNIDNLPASLDSRIWAGGKYIFAGTDADKIITFTGENKTGELVTNDMDLGISTMVSLIRPMVNQGSADVSIASRRRSDDPILFSTAVSATAENRCPVRSLGKFHRIKLTPTGTNWTHAVGVDIEYSDQGIR